MSNVQTITRKVKPVLSLTPEEARRRVLNLYKAWIREISLYVTDTNYILPKTAEQCRLKVREKFLENAHLKDLRVIDLLVIKSQMDLYDYIERYKTPSSAMVHFNDHLRKQPTDFLSKFLQGHNP